jgi:hypothetical protein
VSLLLGRSASLRTRHANSSNSPFAPRGAFVHAERLTRSAWAPATAGPDGRRPGRRTRTWRRAGKAALSRAGPALLMARMSVALILLPQSGRRGRLTESPGWATERSSRPADARPASRISDQTDNQALIPSVRLRALYWAADRPGPRSRGRCLPRHRWAGLSGRIAAREHLDAGYDGPVGGLL